MSGRRVGKRGTVLGRDEIHAANSELQRAVLNIVSAALSRLEDRAYSDIELSAVFHALPEEVRSIPAERGLSDGTFESACLEGIATNRPRPYVIEWGGSFVGTHYVLNIGDARIPLELNGSPYLTDELAEAVAFEAVAGLRGEDAALRAVFAFDWNYIL